MDPNAHASLRASDATGSGASASGDGDPVTTHGWDTAFVIPAGEVNRAIVEHKSSPRSFQQGGSVASLSGTFGDWQVTHGGDGRNVRLAIPMTDLLLQYAGSGKQVHFDSCTAIAEIELEFLPHDDVALDGTSGTPMALKPKLTPDPTGAPVFNVFALLDLTPEPKGLLDRAVVQQTLEDWGNANLQLFDHVFAVVNLNRLVDLDQWGFVTPHYVSYAYLDQGGSVDQSLFSVLCMTGDRSGDRLAQQVAFNAIPKGSVAGFLVSQGRVLSDLVRPAVIHAYPDLIPDDFQLNDGQDTLFLVPGTVVDLAPVEHAGLTYHPQLVDLSIEANGSELALTSHTTTAIVRGITATCIANHWYSLELADTSEGQTLKFVQTRTPVISHSIEQSAGSHLTQLIIDIVATVALLILTVLTAGTTLIVSGLVVGLLLGANQIAPAVIEKVNRDDSPGLDLLRSNAVDPIRWPDTGVFHLDFGKLNQSLQLGGDPQFT